MRVRGNVYSEELLQPFLSPPTCRKRLTVSHIRTLKMSEDVLGVRYSPDQRLLAVALLDCTVKIFFADTLKVRKGGEREERGRKRGMGREGGCHLTTPLIKLCMDPGT